mmetsp:Transcript_12703/g.31697  ORF Transcript_12703/g.31697 Transcript_12703/m.31697 type:complete len:208 (+) Transcript_12703:286-909(+)
MENVGREHSASPWSVASTVASSCVKATPPPPFPPPMSAEESSCVPAGQRTIQSARLPGTMYPAVMSRGAELRYTPSLASSLTSHPGIEGSSTALTAANTIRHRYHRLAAICSTGWYMPLMSTTLICVPETGPSDQVFSSHCAAVPPALRQLVSYVSAMLRKVGMSRCAITSISSGSCAIVAGSSVGSSSTMIIPAAPPPAWMAVEPW